MKSVLETAQEALKGDTVGRMSSLLQESESGTRQGFQEAVPVSVAGLAGQASTLEGAQALLKTFKEGRYAHVDPEDLGQTVADPKMAERVVSSSEGLMGRLFGNKLGGIVDGLAGGAGVSRSSATKLLGLATPLVMGIVGKLALARNLDARGLSGFLGEQQRLAAGAMPSRLAGMFGMAPAFAGAAGGAGAAVRHPERMVEVPHGTVHRRSYLPWMLAGLAVLAGLFWLNARRTHQRAQQSVVTAPAEPTARTAPAQPAAEPPAPVAPTARTAPAEPGAVAPAAPATAGNVERLSAAGGMAALTQALDGDQPLPARFVVSDLGFRQDSAQIEPATARVLDDVTRVLQAHPSAKLRIEGHTDATGDANANLALSQQRADAVKSYLTAQGLGADRLATAGFGSSRPLEPSDTAEARAANRRTELVITQR